MAAKPTHYEKMAKSFELLQREVDAKTELVQRERILNEGDAAANPLRFLPWKAIPRHFGPPWFMPFVGDYYMWKDRVS